MKCQNNALHSSRQSPQCVNGLKKYKNSLYTDMLLRDLTNSFSICLSPKENRNCFYFVEPAKDSLENLLSIRTYRWDDYDFDKLLDEITWYLVVNGKAYLEIVLWKNDEGDYVGLSFEPIHSKRSIFFQTKYYFWGENTSGERISFSIDKKRIICFDLKEIGLSRYYFINLFRRIARINILNSTNFIVDSKLQGKYNSEEHIRRNEFLLLKYTKKIFWYGRNGSNQHLSESYLLYRAAHLKLWRKRFLDYLIEKLNDGLKRYKEEVGFEGKIKVKECEYDYLKELERYKSGEINAEQLANMVFC